MTKRMLIDASHEEETRVVLLDGNRIEEYDVETLGRRQLKGNIYLAKVIRVEPSLQAAFVEYGGNRHGFLAFGEIHPDYYQIPVADRQRLLELQEAEAREDEEAEDRAATHGASEPGDPQAGADAPEPSVADSEAAVDATVQAAYGLQADPVGDAASGLGSLPPAMALAATTVTERRVDLGDARTEFPANSDTPGADLAPEAAEPAVEAGEETAIPGEDEQPASADAEELLEGPLTGEVAPDDEDSSSEDTRAAPEAMGGEQEDQRERRPPPRFLRNYKIQEVIRRRQIMLVQVVKEERGTKGAALTSYISLAGRFSVLMPNSPRGGGISRKITAAADRRRLKEVMTELALPRGMGIIVRTAGANRPKPEIMRDCEYLLNQWDQIRGLTLRSAAPALIYEEASLIKRAMRDLYTRDVEEVQVDGEAGWKAARDFMRMLMPDAARKVQMWRDPQSLFAKHQVEHALDAMLAPNVQLRSGGYLVINQTEALVAIDVNSGRSTRERGVEETALRTNMEAADEVARQLRLRDLAGLIVIDFIDMDNRRHNAMVERRLKEALKHDRARIQIGSISHFGLLEMTRQRLRPSLAETNFVTCPACGGLGHVRSAESSALHVLRAIEEEGAKRRAAEIVVHCAAEVTLYVLNHKRARLAEIEDRFAMQIAFAVDHELAGAQVRIDRIRVQAEPALPLPISQMAPMADDADEVDADAEPQAVGESEGPTETAPETAPEAVAEYAADGSSEAADQPRRRRRRRGRSRARGEAGDTEAATEGEAPAAAAADDTAGPAAEATGSEPEANSETITGDGTESGRRRRSRRGGRRRGREDSEGASPDASPAQEPDSGNDSGPEDALEGGPARAMPTPYRGPTPANPFGEAYDIFELVEQADTAAARAGQPPDAPPVAAPNGAMSPEAAEAATASAAPEPESTPDATPEPEPQSAPPIVPVMVGTGEAAAVPRRGWWRR